MLVDRYIGNISEQKIYRLLCHIPFLLHSVVCCAGHTYFLCDRSPVMFSIVVIYLVNKQASSVSKLYVESLNAVSLERNDV